MIFQILMELRVELKLDKVYIISFLCLSSLYSENINYAVNDNHTLTVPKNYLDIALEYQLMNDTVDILKIKDKEFSNSSKYDAIGDLDGYGLNLRYGISNKLMLTTKYNIKKIAYGQNELNNENIDFFLRYNLFNNEFAYFNSGISFDIGYIKNKLHDFHLDDLDQINDLSKRYFPSSNITIKQIQDNNDPFLNKGDFYIPDNTTADPNDKVKLDTKPVVSLVDTYDESYYLKLLTGIYTKKSLFDIYFGIKKTDIFNKVTTNDELLSKASSQGYNLEKNLNRSEKMYMLGFNYTLESKNFIYEFGFEYDKFVRDPGLDYIDYNYIFDLALSYKISRDIILYSGAKIMYRQLNGQVPYLYNEYTQTTYDHKYGYTKFGIQYKF